MLVNLSISSWTARKYDKKISKEVSDAHGASAEAGRYNKHLMPADAESYKALVKHIGDVRAWHYENTLPWSDEGWRVLTVANYTKYTDYMRQAQHKFDSLLNAFVADYPALKAEARRQFNGLFNSDDYPDSVRGRYDFDIDIKPVPTAGDWRVQLSDEEISVLAEKTESRTRDAFEAAQADAVKRLHGVVAKIVERLGTTEVCTKCNGKGKLKDARKNPTFDKLVTCWTCAGTGEVDGVICGNCLGEKPEGSRVTKTKDTRQYKNNGKKVNCWICDGTGKTAAGFKDTLVENAREICDVLQRINLADDPKLEEYRRQTELLAKAADPDTLRENEKVRATTAQQAQLILDAMSATYGANMFAS